MRRLEAPGAQGSAGRYLLLALLFFLLTVAGNPFRHLDASGHFYLSVLRTLDPELFTDDVVANTLGRFSSAFYPLLGFTAEAAGAGADDLEPILQGLYIAYKLLLVLVILALVRSLGWQRSHELGLFVVFMAWCSHGKNPPIGGAGMLDPTATHREAALLLLLGAVCFLLRGRREWFWVLLAASLFVHATRTLNFLCVVLPPLFFLDWKWSGKAPWRSVSRADLAGLALLLGSASCFYLFMAPPPMSAGEAEMFLGIKGEMVHISPFNQPRLGWVRVLAVAALAVLVAWRDLSSDRKAALLAGFVVSGTLFGLLRGFQAVLYKTVLTTQLVPLRIFLWVWFFAFLLIAMAAVRRGPSPVGAVLAATLALTILSSLWAMPFIFMAIAYYASGGRWPSPEAAGKILTAGTAACVLGMIVFWALGERQPFEGFRDPFPVLAGILLLVLAFSAGRLPARLSQVAIAGLLAVTLLGASLREHRRFHRKYDDWTPWIAVGQWCRENTAKTDRFITPLLTDSFRNLSLRTTLNESRSELVWLAPEVYAGNQEKVGAVIRALDRAGTDELFALASRWGADYVIAEGDRGMEPLYRAGPYSVLRVGAAMEAPPGAPSP